MLMFIRLQNRYPDSKSNPERQMPRRERMARMLRSSHRDASEIAGCVCSINCGNWAAPGDVLPGARVRSMKS